MSIWTSNEYRGINLFSDWVISVDVMFICLITLDFVAFKRIFQNCIGTLIFFF